METTANINVSQTGEVLLQHGLASEALPHLLKACKSEPDKWRHPLNVAIAYRHLGKYQEGLDYLKHAANLSSESWPIFHTWANTLDDLGEFDNALQFRWKAWELCGRSRQEVALGIGSNLLRRGSWQSGWPYWELGRFMYSWSPPPAIPIWQGEKGKRLLILAEGGYGDTFDQARWIPQIDAKVTLCVHKRQIDLLRCSPQTKNVTLMALGEIIRFQDYDYVTSILSLASLLEATPETVPSPINFEIEPCVRQSDRRIGLCWKAEENGTPHKLRSIPSDSLESFRDIKAEWFSLVPRETLWMKPSPDNWLDTARLIKSLDLVISADTAVLHLAGCFGIPSIAMLPINNEWRWLSGRSDTVWYKNMRLVRAKKPDVWDSVIEEVCGLIQ